MRIKIQKSACFIAVSLLCGMASVSVAANQETLSSGSITVINENFKDLVIAITALGKTQNGKNSVSYIQKIEPDRETKFNIRYLGGAKFYSITGVVVKNTTIPFTTSTCNNLDVEQHYKVTFTKVDENVSACRAELLDEAGQVVK